MISFRESLEERLLQLPHVRLLDETVVEKIDRVKDGTFGLSCLGFLLYGHGRNPRGISRNRPNGLLYADNDTTFGIGIFRRESENHGGHLVLVAPRGPDPVQTVQSFMDQVETVAPNAVSRCFVRFLKAESYRDFLDWDFSPISQDPWHPHAPAEDETFCHSRVDLVELQAVPNNGSKSAPRKRRLRDDWHRFSNFLRRNGIQMQPTPYDAATAKVIVKTHFDMPRPGARRIGSVAQDYESLLEADLNHPDRFGFMLAAEANGRHFPVSVFAGEKTNATTLALYCSITRRDPMDWKEALVLEGELKGFSALGTYVYWKAFCAIRERFPEVTHVQLGGSETADLDAFKRRMGAQPEPTYWVVKKM